MLIITIVELLHLKRIHIFYVLYYKPSIDPGTQNVTLILFLIL